jgi:hypothetical protein
VVFPFLLQPDALHETTLQNNFIEGESIRGKNASRQPITAAAKSQDYYVTFDPMIDSVGVGIPCILD